MRHNMLAIVACVVLQAAIGYGFYIAEPLHSQWMSAWGLNPAMMTGDSFQPYFVSIMASVVSLYCLSWLVQKLGVTEWVGGIGLGIVLWVGFTAPMILVHYRFAHVAPVALYLDITKDLFCLVASSVVLAVWRAK